MGTKQLIVADITTNEHLQSIMYQWGDANELLESEEVPLDIDGYLQKEITNDGLSPAEFSKLERALFNNGLIDKIRRERIITKHAISSDVIIDNDNQAGCVIGVRAAHKMPNMNSAHLTGLMVILHNILAFLVESDAEHIFLEEVKTDIFPNDPSFESERSQVRSAFKNFGEWLIEPTEQQLELLRRFGVGRVYYLLKDNVTIHKTTTKEEADETLRKFKEYCPSLSLSGCLSKTDSQGAKKIKQLAFDRREQTTMNEITKFLNQNHGKKVFLIYGSEHDFSPYVTQMPNVGFIDTHFHQAERKMEIITEINDITERNRAKIEARPVQEIPADAVNYNSQKKYDEALILTRKNPKLQAQIIDGIRKNERKIPILIFLSIAKENQIDALAIIDRSELEGFNFTIKDFLLFNSKSNEFTKKIALMTF